MYLGKDRAERMDILEAILILPDASNHPLYVLTKEYEKYRQPAVNVNVNITTRKHP